MEIHTMDELYQIITTLKKSKINNLVNKRIQEFKNIDKNSPDELFKELTFCLLTANFSAERAIFIHTQLNTCFCTNSKETIEKKLKAVGYRFPNTRAAYITESKCQRETIQHIITTLEGEERRDWLVQNITGLGYKEASHFLRNIGFDTYAIVDSHIMELLDRYKIIHQPKTLTKKKYKKIEDKLQTIATHTNLSLAELDLYLWYMETGKILK
jgi:N-glycosylase/DNA lyase